MRAVQVVVVAERQRRVARLQVVIAHQQGFVHARIAVIDGEQAQHGLVEFFQPVSVDLVHEGFSRADGRIPHRRLTVWDRAEPDTLGRAC